MELNGKVILLTGGSSGIGKETARELIAKGAKVAITGRDADKLSRVAKELGAFPIHADAGVPEDIERTFQELLAEFGTLDVLINNAGVGFMRTLEDASWEDFEVVFKVNVYGAAMMAQQAARILREKQGGAIVNIASTAALRGYKGGTVYGASKFALRGMTQAWQAELRQDNIRVIQINPSEVTTAFGANDRSERPEQHNKLRSAEIAHTIVSTLTMDDRGYIPEVTIHATNPFS